MDFIRALLVGGLPVALFTFLIYQWLVSSQRIEPFSSQDELEGQLKRQSKEKKRDRTERREADSEGPVHQRVAGDFFHNKILSFGGGFYGTMALLTYLIIEAVEVWQFLLNLFDPDSWIDRLVPGMVIEFLLNSLMNLVAAFVWFATLPDYIRMERPLLWLAAAYGGYLVGLQVSGRWGSLIWTRAAASLREFRAR